MADKKVYDLEDIKRLLPHRYPFLLVDRVISVVKNKELKAIKNVTGNEEFFQGHFPDNPIMPGVLIVEALAQASALLYMISSDIVENKGDYLVYFLSINGCKFRNPVTPGDTILLEVKPLRLAQASRMSCKAIVDERIVCEAVITAMLRKKVVR